jgi:hypothetical protein
MTRPASGAEQARLVEKGRELLKAAMAGEVFCRPATNDQEAVANELIQLVVAAMTAIAEDGRCGASAMYGLGYAAGSTLESFDAEEERLALRAFNAGANRGRAERRDAMLARGSA